MEEIDIVGTSENSNDLEFLIKLHNINKL